MAFNVHKCHQWHRRMELQKLLFAVSKQRVRGKRKAHMRVQTSLVKLHIQEHFNQCMKLKAR